MPRVYTAHLSIGLSPLTLSSKAGVKHDLAVPPTVYPSVVNLLVNSLTKGNVSSRSRKGHICLLQSVKEAPPIGISVTEEATRVRVAL